MPSPLAELTRRFGLRPTRSPVPMIAGSACPDWHEGERRGTRLALREVDTLETWAGEIEGPSSLVLVRRGEEALDPALRDVLGEGSPVVHAWRSLFATTAAGFGSVPVRLRAAASHLDRLSRSAEGVDIFARGVQLRHARDAPAADVAHDALVAVDIVGALRDAEPPLVKAAREGDFARTRELLRAGADVNAPGLLHETAMLYAAASGPPDLVAEIVAAGWKHEGEGHPALRAACQRGETRIVALLLEAGVSPHGETGFEAPVAIARAAGHEPVARLLLERGARLPATHLPERARPGHRMPRGTVDRIPGAVLLLVSVLLVVVGGVFVLSAAGVLRRGDWSSQEDPAVALLGLAPLLLGAQGVALWARRRSRLPLRRGDWRADHAWPVRVLEEEWRRDLWVPGGVALVLVPFATGLAAHAHLSGDRRLVVGLVSAALLVAALGFVYAVLRRMRRLRRTGAVELVLSKLPLAPGDPLEGTVRTRRYTPVSTKLRATLRCVATFEERDSDEGSSVGLRTLVEDSRPLGEPRAAGDRWEWRVSFALPRDAPGTALSPVPQIYWELYVHGPGLEPDAVFLVPVYAR